MATADQNFTLFSDDVKPQPYITLTILGSEYTVVPEE